MKKLFFLLLLPLLAVVSSCTMEKRLYRPGFHVEMKSSPKNQNKINIATDNNILEDGFKTNSEDKEHLSAASDNSLALHVSDIANIFKNIFLNIDSCDNIIFRNGVEISAKVIEVGVSEIKYKKCSSPNGPIYSVKKSEVFMIKYADGSKDIIPEEKVKDEEETVFDNEDYATLKGLKEEKKKPEPVDEGFGIAGFLIALISIPFWLAVAMGIGMVASIVAIIFGFIGIGRSYGKGGDKFSGKGLSVASLILGLVILIASIALLALLV